jgi:hypothetical protein
MSALGSHVEDYLRLRRALGYKLERHGWLLPQLVAYLEAAGSPRLTSELAISWARLPSRARPNYWAQRLAVARGFARYLHTIDPATEVPPSAVFPARRHRPAPYVWSEQEICGLLAAARALTARGSCRSIRAPATRYTVTPPNATGSARRHVRRRSSSPRLARRSIAAPWRKPFERSRSTSASAPTPFALEHMTSGTALPSRP